MTNYLLAFKEGNITKKLALTLLKRDLELVEAELYPLEYRRNQIRAAIAEIKRGAK